MKKFPPAFTVSFGPIVLAAILTWIIPAGHHERVMSETPGKEAPVPGTYAQVEPDPQGLVAVLLAPIAGLDAGVGRLLTALRGRETRSLVVTADQSANGWVDLFNATFAVVMGGLAIGRAHDRRLGFVWPLPADSRGHRRGLAVARRDSVGRARARAEAPEG